MNHKTQECLSMFGYGTGFERHNAAAGKTEGFCNMCPKKQECWEKHKVIAEAMYPDRFKEFKVLGGDAVAAKKMMQVGKPDPYMQLMFQNIEKGMKDAGGGPSGPVGMSASSVVKRKDQ